MLITICVPNFNHLLTYLLIYSVSTSTTNSIKYYFKFSQTCIYMLLKRVLNYTIRVVSAECSFNGPLGLSTGAVSDSQISASSTYPANWDAGCNERYGRLYQPDGLGWCAKFKTASEWLQVDLGLPAKVNTITTVLEVLKTSTWSTLYCACVQAYR